MFVLANPHMMAMYAVNDSFMWQCKKQILSIVAKLKQKQIQTKYEIVNEYNQWLVQDQ